jgi:hypothetical protein
MTNTVFTPISAIPVFYNGSPAVGAKVYFYDAGATTPRSIWTNSDATTASGNPVTSDGNGVIPPIWVSGTGKYRIVINTSTGQLIRTIEGLPGAAPEATVVGGASSYALTTGDIKWNFDSNEQSGFVILNGQTIGNAGSGAHYADNALTTLFQYLWARLNNTDAPVSSGRGASGLADFNAGKTMGLPDMRFRCLVGRSGMGNTVSSLASDYPFADGVGVFGGANNAVLGTANLPAHTHTGTTGNGAGTIAGFTNGTDGLHGHTGGTADSAGAHDHPYLQPADVPINTGATSTVTFKATNAAGTTGSSGAHTHTLTIPNTGSGHGHAVSLDPATHNHPFTTGNGPGSSTRFDVMNPFRTATCYMKT